MPDPTIPVAYAAAQLTLSGTKQNLYTLLSAIIPNVGAGQTVLLQADPGNEGLVILVGDSDISTTRYGYAMGAGDSRVYPPSGFQSVPISNIWVMCSTGAAPLLNVEVVA